MVLKALKEEEVTVDGRLFSIKKPVPELVQPDAGFERVHVGTWVSKYSHIPSTPRNDPDSYYPVLYLPVPKVLPGYQDDTRPEVALREGIRAAIRGGLTTDKIKEIFEHELVFGVMGT